MFYSYIFNVSVITAIVAHFDTQQDLLSSNVAVFSD